MATDYPDTLDAVRRGETSMAQATVVVEAVESLPTSQALSKTSLVEEVAQQPPRDQ